MIPSELRARVWPILLLHEHHQQQQQPLESNSDVARALREVVLDLPNQRVVEVDALRTRSELPCFRESPRVQRRVERLLTYYCKDSGVTYKQGLNECIAPFIYISLPPASAEAEGDEEADEALALRCFSRFIRLFLRNLYTDEVKEGGWGAWISWVTSMY